MYGRPASYFHALSNFKFIQIYQPLPKDGRIATAGRHFIFQGIQNSAEKGMYHLHLPRFAGQMCYPQTFTKITLEDKKYFEERGFRWTDCCIDWNN